MSPVITTKYGKVEGFEENGLLKFLGMPFAAPLTGDLKWKRAKECQPWEGVLKADHYGEHAPQFNEGKFMGSAENCLTINVVRPQGDEAQIAAEKLPVFVWIHGGGYSIGGCNDSMYYGDEFAKDGCVYVALQYRLSVLGFYEFCTYPGCDFVETNRGLSDMILALKWIHENIAAFGGDPENVTIAGESAGGSAMITLMAVPSVEGYFQKVIAESGLCELVDTVEQQRMKIDLFLEGMGWSEDDPDLGEKLRTTDDYDMVKGHLYQEGHAQLVNPGCLGAGPCIDDLLPMRPIEAMKAGMSKGVKLIIGTNLHEGTMFVRPENTTFPNSWAMIEQCFRQNDIMDRYEDFRQLYQDFEDDGYYGSAFVKFATDTGWEVPSIRFAQAHAPYGDTWMYRFEYLSGFAKETGMLVTHAFELPCVFGVRNHEFSQLFFKGEKEEDATGIINEIHGDWVRFAKEGIPDDGEWEKFEGENPPVRIFDRHSRTERLDRSRLMETWGDIIFYCE